MSEMSPILQARIAERQALHASKRYPSKKVDLTQKPDVLDLSTKKDDSNKKARLVNF